MVEEYIRDHQTNYTKDLRVNGATVERYYQEAGMDHLVVRLMSTFKDYVLDDETGKKISGSKFSAYQYLFELDFMRAADPDAAADETFTCPNCGAGIKINQAGECPYCGTVIRKQNAYFVLDSMKKVR